MYSDLYPETAKHEGASSFNSQTPVKKVSVPAQVPCKFYNEKLATPRLRCAVFVDEARALRYRRPSGRPRRDYSTAETEVLVSGLSSGNYQKPWPSRKGAGVEELVKYMSNVPCYLQHNENVENVQEKALNFGVIDWRQLEKWTNTQKAEKKKELLPSNNKSCSYPARNSNNSLAQCEKTSHVDSHETLSAEKKSGSMADPPNSRISQVSKSFLGNHENFPKSNHEHRTSMQNEAGDSTEAMKSNQCEKRSVPNPLQEDSSVRDKTSSSIHCDRKTVEECKGLSMKNPQKGSQQGSVSRDIPPSGRVAAKCQGDESDMNDVASLTNGLTFPKFIAKSVEANRIDNSTGNYMVSTDEQSGSEGASVDKKQQLMRHTSVTGLKWLSQSSSLKDMSILDNLDGSDDTARSNCRRRRSPLRRLLDPLLKPKNDGNSRPTAKSPIKHFQEQLDNISLSTGKNNFSNNAMNSSSDASIGPSSNQVPSASHGSLQDESYCVPMRQALLKLAWKDAQPLLMFSTDDNNVLVASMRRTGRLGKDDPSAVYTIVTAQESKKKGGIWTGQSKNRKPNLLYDVVGHMEVSCSKLSSFDSKDLEMSRQFVLVGKKSLPQDDSVNSVCSCELAAMVIKAPYQNLKRSIYNTHVKRMQIEKYPDNSRMCRVAAILPSGIHGLSDKGKPSTLIERWKSGGSCDCEGWDEGCRLIVLTDRLPDMKIARSVPEFPVTNAIHHIELFSQSQGKRGGNKYAFSMIAFKECLYTIEFGPWISSLQAFSICIAILHDISTDAVENYPLMNSIQRNGGLTGFEPHCPPFSPVGRS